MPFNFYAETSFTEMCGYIHFGVHPHPQLSNDRHPVLPAAVLAVSDCHGLKNFSAIGMNDVTS